MTFKVASARDGGCVIVSAAGDVDRLTAPALEKELRTAWQPGSGLIIDLAEVPFCDSSGVRVLALARRWTSQSGDFLGLVALDQRVARILQITSLDSAFKVYQSVTEAIEDSTATG